MKMFRAGMWLILGAVVVLGLSVAAPVHAALYTYNGHDYEVISAVGIDRNTANWEANTAFWFLATIADAGEEAFIESLLTLGGREQYWLGGIVEAGVWTWDNGNPWTGYTNWGEGQPDNWEPDAPQIYLAMDSDLGSWGWDDNSNYLGLIQGYVRERVAPVPEPSTLLLLGSGLLGLVGFGKRRMKK